MPGVGCGEGCHISPHQGKVRRGEMGSNTIRWLTFAVISLPYKVGVGWGSYKISERPYP